MDFKILKTDGFKIKYKVFMRLIYSFIFSNIPTKYLLLTKYY